MPKNNENQASANDTSKKSGSDPSQKANDKTGTNTSNSQDH